MQGPEDISTRRAAGDAACVAVGRDPATLGRSASVVINLPMGQGWQHSSAQGKQQGPTSPEEVAEMLHGYARAGLSHVQLWLTPNTSRALSGSRRFSTSGPRRSMIRAGIKGEREAWSCASSTRIPNISPVKLIGPKTLGYLRLRRRGAAPPGTIRTSGTRRPNWVLSSSTSHISLSNSIWSRKSPYSHHGG